MVLKTNTNLPVNAATGNSDLPEGFKMTELGPLPEEWEVVRLGEVAQFERGVSWSKNDESNVGVGVLSIPNIGSDGQISPLPRVFIRKTVPEHKILKSGDILLVGSSGSLSNVGRHGIFLESTSSPLTFASFTIRVRSNESDLFQSFLPYLMLSSWVPFSAFSKRAADGKYNLQVQQLRHHIIPLPPLPEQRAIAQVLRTVQRAREATERVLAATRELKKSLMRHLFTYGPVPIDQVDQVRLKETEIGPVPEEWRVVSLGELFSIQQGAALSPKRRAGQTPQPFLRTSNIFWGRLDLTALDRMDFSKEETQRLALQPRDLLICEGGEVGRTALWSDEVEGCLYQNHVYRVRAHKGGVEPAFYMYWMQVAILYQGLYGGYGNKTTIPNLSKSRLSSFPVPLPPLSEQQAIADILRTVDRKIQAEEQRKAALDALFKTLLHHLMTGKVRVRSAITEPEE